MRAMKTELNNSERLNLLTALPTKGGIDKIKILRELREDLSFSEIDHEKMGMKAKMVGDLISWRWQKDKDIPKDIHVGNVALEMIRKVLTEINKKEISEDSDRYISLYEKFMEKSIGLEMIRKVLSEMNEKEMLEERHISIYEKFMEQENDNA